MGDKHFKKYLFSSGLHKGEIFLIRRTFEEFSTEIGARSFKYLAKHVAVLVMIS